MHVPVIIPESVLEYLRILFQLIREILGQSDIIFSLVIQNLLGRIFTDILNLVKNVIG